ncbi:MAG: tetratricopeptide repeat protein [Bacteroidota bacterium]
MLLFLGGTFSLQAQDEKSAADLYNEGVELMKAKDFAGALPLFEQAIDKAATAEEGDSTAMQVTELAKKNGMRTAYSLGNKQRKAKEYDAAIETFDKGLAMGDFYALYMGKAQALDKSDKKEKAVEAYFTAGKKYEEAGQEEAKVVKIYRTAFIKLARAKKYDAIIEKAEAHPVALKNADVSYYVAKAYSSKKDYEKALMHAQAATAAAPDGKDKGKFYMLEGEINTKLTKTGDAIAAYKKVESGSKYADRAAYLIKELGGE